MFLSCCFTSLSNLNLSINTYCTHADIPSGSGDLPACFSALWLFRHQLASRPVCWHETSATKGHVGVGVGGWWGWVCMGKECHTHTAHAQTQLAHHTSAALTAVYRFQNMARHAARGWKQKNACLQICMCARTQAYTYTKACCAGQVKLLQPVFPAKADSRAVGNACYILIRRFIIVLETKLLHCISCQHAAEGVKYLACVMCSRISSWQDEI